MTENYQNSRLKIVKIYDTLSIYLRSSSRILLLSVCVSKEREGPGSSAFMEDRFKPFILDRAVEM
jgi:hypothetical protein